MTGNSVIFDTVRPWLDDEGFTTARVTALDAACVKLLDKGVGEAVAPVKVIAPKPATGPLSFAQQQIDLSLLKMAFPANKALEPWVEPTRIAMVRWGIDTTREVASFLANINIESAGLTRLSESLNYSTDALIAKFGRHRISSVEAQKWGRNQSHEANQEMLANILYGGEFGRKNLGNTEPGDGWRFRGYGPKQLTGRANQGEFAKAMVIPVEDVPAYVRTPEGGMMSAGWFWKSHDLDAKAATPGLEDDRKAINGGTFGLAEVEATFDKLLDELLRRERA